MMKSLKIIILFAIVFIIVIFSEPYLGFSPTEDGSNWLNNIGGIRNFMGLSTNSYLIFVFIASFILAVVLVSLGKNKK